MLKDMAARRIFKKYLRRDIDGDVCETIEESFNRVAMGISSYDYHPAEFYYTLLNSMVNLEFVPNRPAWFGIGRAFGFTSACTFFNVDDSLMSITSALTNGILVQQAGGGVGWGMSDLRAAGSIVRSTGGQASGPVSFLRAFNSTLGQVQQGGWMMGANNAGLSIDHPDIDDFIAAKLDDKSLDQFNTNILITNQFMSDWTASVTIRNRLTKISHAMWKNGGIGIQFVDTANRANMIPGYGRLLGTNPCSEFWMFDGESCQPGYINMTQVIDATTKTIDWQILARISTTGTRCMDNLIDANRYIPAVPKLKEMAQATRRMGIGPTGLADMMIMLGIKYGSDEAVDLTGQVMEFILFHAMTESVRLSKERSPFPLIEKSAFAPDYFTWKQPKPIEPYRSDFGRPALDWSGLVADIKLYGIRNCGHTVIAPSSFGSQTMGTEGYGLEPIFAPNYDHKHGDGSTDRTTSELSKMPSFVAAHEVSPQAHINMVAAAQPFVTESISKTVNLPFGASQADVQAIIYDAWNKGLKNVIVYREGSRKDEVLVPCIDCAVVA